MFGRILLVLGVSLFVFGVRSYAMTCCGGKHEAKQQIAQAHDHDGHGVVAATEEATPKEAVNVGNKICPVSGETIGQGGMAPETYEYEGKVYNFCCASCITTFKKDPEKYIKKVEEELQKPEEQGGDKDGKK